MKTNKKAWLLVVVLSLAGMRGYGAEGVYSPVANLTERFTNNPAWSVQGSGSVAVSDQALRWSYPSQAMPITRIGAMKADGLSSNGRFVGDYANSAITHAAFDVKRTGLSSTAYLTFSCNNGHLWYCSIPLPSQNNVWESRNMPMTYSDAWRCDEISDNFSATFESDRTQVKEMTIQAITVGTASQELKVDNFKVVGPWEKGPMTADEMPLYWLMENGLAAQAGQAGLDKDGDGFRNYAEYIAGTDPNDASSQFKLSIALGSDGKPVLTWPRASYRAYTVLKSSDLTVADSFSDDATPIQSVGEQSRVTLADGSDGASFYKVKIDKVQ